MVRLQLVPTDDDALFVERLKAGDVSARSLWFDDECRRVQGLVLRLIGPRHDVHDLVHDVFVQAFGSVATFHGDRTDLKAWLTGVTVRVVRMQLKKWRVRRIMRLWGDVGDEVDVLASQGVSAETSLAVRRTWEVLARLSTDERLAFALRYFNQLELTEVAAALEVSLATAKRRLSSGHQRFLQLAQRDPVLSDWVERFSHDD